MTQYPLLFDRRELIEGNGFIAGVAVSGRALLAEEQGEFWVEGVNPGGFAANGGSPGEALAAFGTELRTILFDLAADATSFEAFRAEVERFFSETSAPALAEWEEAVREVRQGHITADWLTHRPADSPLRVEVARIERPSAANNQVGEAALAA
jgi:hypothetical protein